MADTIVPGNRCFRVSPEGYTAHEVWAADANAALKGIMAIYPEASKYTIEERAVTEEDLGPHFAEFYKVRLTGEPALDLVIATWATAWMADTNNDMKNFSAALARLKEGVADMITATGDVHQQVLYVMDATVAGMRYGNW